MSDTSGFKEFEQALEALRKDVATKIGQAAVRKGAVVMAKAVKANAPTSANPTTSKIYGRLKTNVKVAKGKSKNATNVSALISTGRAFWAIFLEFGTTKMKAVPFFKPAVEGSATAALKAIADELRKRIAKASVK